MKQTLKSAQTLLAVLLLAATATTSDPRAQSPGTLHELTVEYIMRDRKWLGSQPSDVFWSDDSRRVYFDWNPNGADGDSLYVVERKGGAPRQVTLDERKSMPASRGEFDRKHKFKVYEKNGDLFLLEVKRGNIHTLTSTSDRESSPAFSLDGGSVTYVRDDNMYRLELASGALSQLTSFREGSKREEGDDSGSQRAQWLKHEELALIQTLEEARAKRERRKDLDSLLEPKRPRTIYIQKKSVDWVQPAPDGRHVCFVLADEPSESEGTNVPNYVTESGYTEDLPAREKVGSAVATYELGIFDLPRDTVYYVSVDSLPGVFTQPAYLAEYVHADSTRDTSHAESKIPRSLSFGEPVWTEDGSRCALDIRSQDFKDRWLAVLNLETGRLSTVDHQYDEAWIGGPGVGWGAPLGWLADNRTLWFQSEQSGYSHIYTVNVETSEHRQRTSGAWEVADLEISQDRARWYFHANIDHAGDWQFYRLSTSGGDPEKLTARRGEYRAQLSPDEKTLALLYSQSNMPTQLYLQENQPGAPARPVTQSISEEFFSYPWREPEIVYIPASDGARVPARLYQPRQPATGGPGVIFVHGAGYLQNVTYGWSGYDREYMFHNLLADRGYTVLDIDYRGSSGYGRDWRTAIYRYMGGKDLSDQIDGTRFLVTKYEVDSARIGIYGGSYGGFITLMALFQHPGVFACGAALRSVTDWAHYNHWYTARILNTPQTDSLAYVRSSPIYFAEGLQDPLLMCHSILDVNVQFQDIVRLTQRLIELGKKNWELAVYPLEDHSIVEPEAWTDEYGRIFELFEKHLNGARK